MLGLAGAVMVLNLIITGIPSIQNLFYLSSHLYKVLNLIITGIPSIQNNGQSNSNTTESFKPYYNWNTFNTLKE